ncbi:MAG: transcription antitermination factor NusB [Candidatus Gracilibacteria bacterium]|nr:transcription antitermination factor NusB [Candidatus Gracilibacteria bacterium]
MQKISRHKTRSCVFQALYSKIYLKDSFSKESFVDSFFDEGSDFVDHKYFDEVFAGVQDNETRLLYVINKYAPRFDIGSMPTINIIPILIAGYEMLYIKCDTIPEKVSIDEALELTKEFSDGAARSFVNGVLNSLKENKVSILKEIEEIQNTNLFFPIHD